MATLAQLLRGFQNSHPGASYSFSPTGLTITSTLDDLTEARAHAIADRMNSRLDRPRGFWRYAPTLGLAGIGTLLLPGLGTLIGAAIGAAQYYRRQPEAESFALGTETYTFRNLTWKGIRNLLNRNLFEGDSSALAVSRNRFRAIPIEERNERTVKYDVQAYTANVGGNNVTKYKLVINYAANPAQTHLKYIKEDLAYITQTVSEARPRPRLGFFQSIANAFRGLLGRPALTP